jgi:hypothetical protein
MSPGRDSGVANNQALILTNNMRSQSPGFIVNERGTHSLANSARHSPLLTLESGQCVLRTYPSQRDAANALRCELIPRRNISSRATPNDLGINVADWHG